MILSTETSTNMSTTNRNIPRSAIDMDLDVPYKIANMPINLNGRECTTLGMLAFKSLRMAPVEARAIVAIKIVHGPTRIGAFDIFKHGWGYCLTS